MGHAVTDGFPLQTAETRGDDYMWTAFSSIKLTFFFTVGIGLRRAAGSSGGAEKSSCLKQGEIENDEFLGFC